MSWGVLQTGVGVAGDVRKAVIRVAGRGAGLVEPVVRGAPAAQHVTVGERTDRVADRQGGAEPAERRVGRGEAFPAGGSQLRVVLAEPGRAQQQVAGTAVL